GMSGGTGGRARRSLAADQPYEGVAALAGRATAGTDALEALVAAGACDEWGPRRELLWRLGVTPRGESAGDGARQLALPLEPTAEIPKLRPQTDWEHMLADYRHTGIPVGRHPPPPLRPAPPPPCMAGNDPSAAPRGARVEVAGMAVARQRPSTANGIVFMLLEDEHGQMNLIIPPPVYEAHRAIVRGEPLLLARGRFERVGRNENVLVDGLESPGPLARRAANDAEVRAALPGAHHFGHR